ncbi:MAG: IclR family transcriptional regulator, partial [Chloroflexi bacterium]|nr:IclR family transcriptional regulator [Chloroflexota bacterium]
MTRSPRTDLIPGRGYGRTFDLLAALVDERKGLSPAALGRRLGIPKSTVSLMLMHFRARDVVTPAEDGHSIVIGPELIKLAFRIVSDFDIRRIARPELEWLVSETREDVYLGVRHGLEMIYIDRVEGLESIRLKVELGAPRPLHSTAVGKLLLAFSPPELLDTVLAAKGLPRRTARTITDRVALEKHLAAIRKQGYAIGDGENVEEIAAIAVPV